MNKKYERYKRYIEHIVNDIESPYFINMIDNYGLKDNEYELVLSKVYEQPVSIKDNYVFDSNGNVIYQEDSNGYWYKKEYDTNNNEIYFEKNNGYWEKYEYNSNNNEIYYENSNGVIIDKR